MNRTLRKCCAALLAILAVYAAPAAEKTVYLKDFLAPGAAGTDAVPAVRAALEHCAEVGASRLVLPGGQLRMRPDRAVEKYQFISNNDESLKRIAFDLVGMRDFEIDGNGTELLFTGFISPFSLEDCENITVRDLTMHRPFEYTVSEIRMRSRDFDPSKRNSMTVDARMQKTGSAKLRWEGTLEDMDNQNITLWLTNLDLRDFGPYCEHYTAYPLTKGNLTFRSQNVIRDRYLDGTNHLDMFEPKVDKKRREIKAEMNIPLKLGLYVLKDKKGHVKMDLPVRGSLDSPEFSYRKIVLKAIGNVLLKVVTAPFSFLSNTSISIRCNTSSRRSSTLRWTRSRRRCRTNPKCTSS